MSSNVFTSEKAEALIAEEGPTTDQIAFALPSCASVDKSLVPSDEMVALMKSVLESGAAARRVIDRLIELRSAYLEHLRNGGEARPSYDKITREHPQAVQIKEEVTVGQQMRPVGVRYTRLHNQYEEMHSERSTKGVFLMTPEQDQMNKDIIGIGNYFDVRHMELRAVDGEIKYIEKNKK